MCVAIDFGSNILRRFLIYKYFLLRFVDVFKLTFHLFSIQIIPFFFGILYNPNTNLRR